MISAPTNAQTVQLLWYNTFLLHGLSLTKRLQPGAKPMLLQRTYELSTRLRSIIHAATSQQPQDMQTSPLTSAPKAIFALCEIFDPHTLDLLYENLDTPHIPPTATPTLQPQIRHTSGPEAGTHDLPRPLPRWVHNISRASHNALPLCSGLQTFTANLPITRTLCEPFHIDRGHPLRDPDFWANKGVLLTEIDLGPGKIELFSTHLFSGQVIGQALYIAMQRLKKHLAILPTTRLPTTRSARRIQSLLAPLFSKLTRQSRRLHFLDLPAPRRLEIQRAQLQQLVTFIVRHHHPENVILLAGDFNLNAHVPAERELLARELDKLKQHGITLQNAIPAFHAGNRPLTTIIRDEYLFHEPCPEPQFSPGPWLDYVFLERATPQHACTLEILHNALRPLPRDAAHRLSAPSPPSENAGIMHYLSDHIALELTLRAKPRPARTRAPHSDR